MDKKEIESFWSRVNKTENCWLWIGNLFPSGYGRFMPRRNGKKVVFRAHRYAWEVTHGAIPEGLIVCHKCDVKECVNPAHLFVGTNADNTRDMIAKGRSLAGERSPVAKLTWSQVDEIRSMYAGGGFRQVDLADRFGISQPQVGNIVRGDSWREDV